MSDLDDDIARIAALRGKKREDYIDPATNSYRSSGGTSVGAHHIALIFTPGGDVETDLEAYDALPPSARQYVRNCPLPLNAPCYADALVHMDGERLETLVQAHLPGQMRAWIQRHYGTGHPSVRRLPP